MAKKQAKFEGNKPFTRDTLAEFLSVSTQTIAQYEKRGLIKGVKLGRRIFYDRDQVDNLLKVNH